MTYAVEFQAVSRRFGELQALDDISFTIAPGEFFGLLGPNGAGKTTLISVLGGLVRPDSGRAFVMGHDVATDYLNSRRQLGMVPQELVFDPFFTVRETLRFQAGYFGLHRADDWIDEILHHLGLSDKADKGMRTLSGGMKRRVLVGQALVHKPPVIVLDEPTAGVDVELRHALWAFISRLNKEGHTVLLTTHYLPEAETLCGRIAMLKAGRVVALDHKHRLLSPFEMTMVRLTAARVPDSWQARVRREEGQSFLIELQRLEELETLLAALRADGIAVKDLQVEQTDLEQVFLRLTGSGAKGNERQPAPAGEPS
ncbi:MAG: ABC transporter ATP-binding protein [Burkholderiales bacterium]|jgi:ABC-2 type transport system ATP-binding protein|nr:ABC transporter ATP-binding protein [Burkholderiales bacterium]